MSKNCYSYRNPKVLNNLYWNLGLSTIAIGKKFHVDNSTIWRWVEKHKIPRRPTKLKKYNFSSTLLKELYWKKKLSIRKIAKKLHVSYSTIHNLMIGYNIRHRTTSEANIKYVRKNFSGDIVEKAYLLGLRAGDVNVIKCCKQVRARVASTHPAEIKLVKTTFGRYGHLSKYTQRVGDVYEFGVNCHLDSSFNFLIKNPKKIFQWILKEDDAFYAFLAGYADSEGSWCILKNHNTITFKFGVGSADKVILKQFYEYFYKLKFHPRFRLSQKGLKGRSGIRNKDIFSLEFTRKSEVISLAKRLLSLSKHDEKIECMKLMLKLKTAKYWSEIENKVLDLRRKRKEKAREYSKKAEEIWLKNHDDAHVQKK